MQITESAKDKEDAVLQKPHGAIRPAAGEFTAKPQKYKTFNESVFCLTSTKKIKTGYSCSRSVCYWLHCTV